MLSNNLVGCLHLKVVVCVYGVSDIALYVLGNWKNNLEDWAAEDWNEDVRGFNSLPILFYIHHSKRQER